MLGKKITSFVVLEQNVLVPISHRLHNARGSGELDRGTRNKEQCLKAGCQHPKAEPVHPETWSNSNHDNPEVSQLLLGVNYRQLGGVGDLNIVANVNGGCACFCIYSSPAGLE